MELIDHLTKNLGVSKDQAEGGAGLLFKQAKENLSGADFAKLSKVVPGFDKLINAAPASDAPATGGGDTRAGLGDLSNLFSGSGGAGGGLGGLGDLLSGSGGGAGAGGGVGDLLSGLGGGAGSGSGVADPSSLLSGLGSGGGGGLSSLAGLAGGFSKLGLNAGMIAKFLPIIMSFLQSKGGEGLKGLLGNAFK
jgi:hypothetical protein